MTKRDAVFGIWLECPDVLGRLIEDQQASQSLSHGVLWFNYSTEDRTVMWSWELAMFRTEAEAKAFQAGVDLSDNHIGFMWPSQRDDVIDWLSEFVDDKGRPVTIADVEAAIHAQCGPDKTG